MTPAQHTILIVMVFCQVTGHPVGEQIKRPLVENLNPHEINQLNYIDSKRIPNDAFDLHNSLKYIDETVKEVEAKLNANASLPRLTRGEILEIIQNITRTDVAAAHKQKSYERNQKAVMLVMPYTPNNEDDGKMQELFTKPPITKIVNDSSNPADVQVTHQRKRRPSQKNQDGNIRREAILRENSTVSNIRLDTGEKTLHVPDPTYNVTLKPPVFTQKPSTKVNIQSYNYRHVTKANVKQILDELTTERIKRRRTSSTQKPTLSTEISIKSTTEINTILQKRRPIYKPLRHPNHKYPEDSELISQKPTSLPFIPNPSQFTTQKPVKFTHQTVAAAKPSQPHRFTTAKPSLLDVHLPDELKSTLDDFDLGDSFNRNPVKYDFFNLPNTQEKIEHNYDTFTPDQPPLPDISNVANTPEMQELLINFGLLTDPKHPLVNVKEEPFIGVSTAEVRPDSYLQFKPLPDIGTASDEMEEFLERFGLGKSARRERKEKKIQDPQDILSEDSNIELDVIPDALKHVAKDMGLINRDMKKINTNHSKNNLSKSEKHIKSEKKHVFKPMETSYTTQDELDRLNQLMDIIKQLERLNGSATDEDLSKIDMKHLRDLVGSFDHNEFVPLDEHSGAPDPINYDFGVSKNEVKRQENSTAATTPASTPVETETVNIKDLEDSFGGQSDSEVEVTVPPPTQAPKTGFYYLLDWNTFLDIDDQKGKRVNLRFQPKAGNPREFISVSVP